MGVHHPLLAALVLAAIVFAAFTIVTLTLSDALPSDYFDTAGRYIHRL